MIAQVRQRLLRWLVILSLLALGSLPAYSAANIKVTKYVSKTTPAEGDTITYTIRVQNTSSTNNSATFTVHDTLPPGTTYISSTSSVFTSSYDPSLHTWTITGPYNAQRMDSLQIVARVNAGTEGRTIFNTALKEGNNGDTHADDTSRVSIQVVSQPPVITSAQPVTGTRFQSMSVKLAGAHFIQGTTQVDFGPGIIITSTTVNSPDTMTANIYITSGAPVAAHDIRVVNPPPGGGSDSLAGGFSVDNPLPVLTTISPTTVHVQDAQFTLTVNGSHFLQNTSVTANGSNRTTTYTDSTKLQATIPASDLLIPGPLLIRVYNPAPGGGLSAATDSIQVNASADLSVRKELGVVKKDTITYVITAKNLGPNDATGASLTDNLPLSLIYISSSASGTSHFDSATHIWNIGSIAVGDSAQCLIVTRLANPNAMGVTITNIARNLTAQEYDRVPANNSDSVSILLKPMRPGDTNNDLTVDAADIIEIGLCYGITGPPRSGSPDTLQQYLAPGWNTTNSPEVCAYADCNGNGTVDSGDVWTIISNWKRTNWTGQIEPVSPPPVSRESIIRQLLSSAELLPPARAKTEIIAMLQHHLQSLGSHPAEWALEQNYPNPFNGETSIRYSIPQRMGTVNLNIYDVLGRIVRTFTRRDADPGNYEIQWDGTTGGGMPAASGVYYYRLETASFAAARKLLYIR